MKDDIRNKGFLPAKEIVFVLEYLIIDNLNMNTTALRVIESLKHFV